MKQSSFLSFVQHFIVFVIVEVIFVLVIFRELPEISLYKTIGVLHLSYWLMLLLSGWMREYATKVRQRFLATYLPIIYHLGIHLYAGRTAIEVSEGEAHDEHSLIWMIVSALLLGALIFAGEWYLHRFLHCKTHHMSVHKHCEDDCEYQHKK